MALSTEYDPIFRRYAGRLPVAFLRALSYRESGQRPDLVMPGGAGAARGLLQVVGVVREDFNRRHGTSYGPDDLLDPEINVRMAAEVLNSIDLAYQKHPSKNMKESWGNPEFVKLLTAGWNSGYSESAGVGRVASYLEQRGIPVTHDAVFENAAAAGGTRYLQDGDKQAWQRTVASLYYSQPDWSNVGTGIGAVILGVAIAWGAYQIVK